MFIELKKGADAQNLCNLLYKKTRLEDTFGVNMLAVADGKPETMGLVSVIRHICTCSSMNLQPASIQTLLDKGTGEM